MDHHGSAVDEGVTGGAVTVPPYRACYCERPVQLSDPETAFLGLAGHHLVFCGSFSVSWPIFVGQVAFLLCCH